MSGKERGEDKDIEALGAFVNYINFFKELYSPIHEFLRQAQDYLKVLISLNTATALILIAILDKIFPSARFKYLLLFSLICIVVSLASALRTMIIINDFCSILVSGRMLSFVLLATGAIDLEKRKAEIAEIKEAATKIARKQKFWYSLGNYSYLGGIAVLIGFVAVNFSCK